MSIDYFALNAIALRKTLNRVSVQGDANIAELAINAIVESINVISPKLIWKTCPNVIVVLGDGNRITYSSGMVHVTFTIKSPTLHATMENLCFIDCVKLMEVSSPVIRVASILEELVHALMHVDCEDFVKHVVTAMYPSVAFRNGQYVDLTLPTSS